MRLLKRLAAFMAPSPAAQQPRLRVLEVDDAQPLAGELFRRTYGHAIPDFPRHFLLLLESTGKEPVAVGYVHYTPFHTGYLAGGLIADAWRFRALPDALKEQVRSHGGMAQWLMAQSCTLLQPCDAVYACIGDAKSLAVNTRVGFRPTGKPHLYILQSPGAAPEQLAQLTTRVAANGMF